MSLSRGVTKNDLYYWHCAFIHTYPRPFNACFYCAVATIDKCHCQVSGREGCLKNTTKGRGAICDGFRLEGPSTVRVNGGQNLRALSGGDAENPA